MRVISSRLSSHEWRLLGILGTATLIDGYDQGIMGLALVQIQSALKISDAHVGALAGIVRLGVILSFPLVALADKLGRRRLLFATIIGFTVATAGTSLVRSAGEFVLCQFVARLFIAAESAIGIVVVVEEFTSSHRGFGIGLLAALCGCGYLLSSLVFGVVAYLELGWRTLYLIGLLPLAVVTWLRRSLPETHRFIEGQEQRDLTLGRISVWGLLTGLVVTCSRSLGLVCAIVAPYAFAATVAFTFAAKTLEQAHGYSASQVARVYIIVGLLQLLANIGAGILGDRLGRRRLLLIALAVNLSSLFIFYSTSGYVVPLALALATASAVTVEVLLSAIGGELFPTEYRSTASGVRAIVATIAAAVGLWLEGRFFLIFGAHQIAISLILLVEVVLPILVFFYLPETAGRNLEEISGGVKDVKAATA